MNTAVDPVLSRLLANVRRAQAELDAYLTTGVAPPVVPPLVPAGWVPIPDVIEVVPVSDDTVRRDLKHHQHLGRRFGKKFYVDLSAYRAFRSKKHAANAANAVLPPCKTATDGLTVETAERQPYVQQTQAG